jgi:hypothetical protein
MATATCCCSATTARRCKGWATGILKQGGLRETYLGALAALVVLYPACAWYRGYKQAHPDSWTRYL